MEKRKCSKCHCSRTKSYILVFLRILHKFLKIFGIECSRQNIIQQQTYKDNFSYQITKTLQFITEEKAKLEFDPQTFKLANPTGKPLCVMLTWMFAERRHIDRYVKIYTEQGFDILTVALTAVDAMWPAKGTQVTAANVAKFLHVNEPLAPVVLHGFSSGAYMWGEVCVAIANNKNYQSLIPRVVAQVWDSTVDFHIAQKGFSMALFPKSKFMQNVFNYFFKLYLKIFHNIIMIPLMRASGEFHNVPCLVPALIFVSSIDPLGSETANISLKEKWTSLGVKVTFKCWNDSPHVQHLAKHPNEYLTLLYNHLDEVGLLKDKEKMNTRIK